MSVRPPPPAPAPSPAPGAHPSTTSPKQRNVSPTANVSVRPEAIAVQIRDLDARMTSFREERHSRSNQIEADRKELAHVEAEIARLESQRKKTEKQRSERSSASSVMHSSVATGKKGLLEINHDARDLLMKVTRQSRSLQRHMHHAS